MNHTHLNRSSGPVIHPQKMDEWACHKINKIIKHKPKYPAYISGNKINKIIANLLFQNLYHQIYQKAPLSEERSEMVVMTKVMMDGLGDYYNALAFAETVKKEYPEQRILMVIHIQPENLKNIRINKQFDYCFAHSGRPSQEADRVRVNNAAYVFEVSYPFEGLPETYHLYMAKHDMKEKGKHQFIGEYGGSRFSMGLEYLEKGIFIKDMPKRPSLMDLTHKTLKKSLFKKKSPNQKDIQKYMACHALFFSYIHTEEKIMLIYLYTVIASQNNQNKTIDLISHLTSKSKISVDFLKKYGIGKVECIRFMKSGKVIKSKTKLANVGKTLRILNIFPLPQEEIHRLMVNSEDFIGCTGDQSFTEAVSFKKYFPFYEIRCHKQGFFDSFQALAANEMPEKQAAFKNYLDACKKAAYHIDFATEKQIEKRSLRIATALQSPQIFEEAIKINRLLRKKFSFNEVLKGIVARQKFHQKYPELQETEKLLKKSFKQGNISLQEMWDQMESTIDNIQNFMPN